jgi:hypothetical protein
LLHQNDIEKQVSINPNPSNAGNGFYKSGNTDAKDTLFNALKQSIEAQIKVQGLTIAIIPIRLFLSREHHLKSQPTWFCR